MTIIDNELPKDWKDLELKVAGIFKEIGYNPVETQKKLDLVRGEVNADVYAEDNTQSPKLVYLCECKQWSSRVPKNVIHAFRTVMMDFGANVGIIISKKGFQKGAFDSVKNTNVELVDWFEFQNMFFKKWVSAYSKKVAIECDSLIAYTEPLIGSGLVRKLDDVKKSRSKRIDEFMKLREVYMPVGLAILSLGFSFLRYINQKSLPLELKLSMDPKNTDSIKFQSYRSYLEYLKIKGTEGIEKIEYVLNEANY